MGAGVPVLHIDQGILAVSRNGLQLLPVAIVRIIDHAHERSLAAEETLLAETPPLIETVGGLEEKLVLRIKDFRGTWATVLVETVNAFPDQDATRVVGAELLAHLVVIADGNISGAEFKRLLGDAKVMNQVLAAVYKSGESLKPEWEDNPFAMAY